MVLCGVRCAMACMGAVWLVMAVSDSAAVVLGVAPWWGSAVLLDRGECGVGKLWKKGGGCIGKFRGGGGCLAVTFGKCWESSRVVLKTTAVTNREVLGWDGWRWHVRGIVVCGREQGGCDVIGVGKESGELVVDPGIVQPGWESVSAGEVCG